MTNPNTDALLDRPIWHALTTRQADLTLGDARAVRFRPGVNLLAAAADGTLESLSALAALVPDGATLGLFEAQPQPLPPGLREVSARVMDQMVLTRLDRRATSPEIVPLGAADVPEMLALTALTVPGPFFAETYLQGGYVGVRSRGRLVAMAGQRLRPPGFAEVSTVCTHPEHRGQGLARAVMEAVIADILAAGEAAILHAYSDNPALALYRALGFRTRRVLTFTLLEQAK